jgi:hypothetical protein
MGIARVYKAGTPYSGVELEDLDYEQTTDTLYLAHLNHAPSKLVREDHDDWRFSTLLFGPKIDPPNNCVATATIANFDAENSSVNYFPQSATYVVTAVNDITGQESRASNASTAINDLSLKRNFNEITWEFQPNATRYNIYKADNQQFFGYIGTTEFLNFVDDNIGPALDRSPPRGENPFIVNGNPSTVCLFEQRLMWGRTRLAPNGIWGSRIGINELENHDRARPARADDSFSLGLVSSKVAPVNQLVATTSLFALTTHSIFAIDGDGQGGVIKGNSPPSARPEVNRGATRLRALPIDNSVFHATSVGYSIRAVGYNFEIDGNRSNNVSIFSPHLFEGFQIVDWAYAAEPRSIIWAVRSDGKLLAFTWEQEQNVWGWTLCETQGRYKSVCAISEDGEDRAYFVVEREINGVTRTFIERMGEQLWTDVEDACFLDCAVSGSFPEPRGTFSGLSHLEGETVAVQADDAVYEGLVVENGSVTLPQGATATRVTIGLPYTVEVETLPFRMMSDSGTNIGRRQQPADVTLQLGKTSNIYAGIPSELYRVKQEFSNSENPLVEMEGLTSSLAMANKASDEITIAIRQTLPSPFELLAIIMEPVVNG